MSRKKSNEAGTWGFVCVRRRPAVESTLKVKELEEIIHRHDVALFQRKTVKRHGADFQIGRVGGFIDHIETNPLYDSMTYDVGFPSGRRPALVSKTLLFIGKRLCSQSGTAVLDS
ncbi:hypothetical protein HYFRA_00006967 [Hymenoscyphus fraxineus]|uniref:Uncharacterized protein n=1 Tax=Hymenoscyphus fraxineus TaxID=746836 RepID=A0A9N9KNN8_9HELO|nr:hypothetical protein HYFRA_00006967 [Hymenoscyphus fraxineus]